MPKKGVMAMEQKSTQDYLKAIYTLSRNKDVVTTTEISKKLDVAPASVTEMLKKLSEDDYIKYEPYKGSSLTKKGLAQAQKILRKHRLLETFLADILHIGKDKVHSQACQMEHTLSDEAEESLCRLLKHPDICSDDGNTIPACDLPFTTCEECTSLHSKGQEEVGKRKENLLALSELRAGQSGKIQFIRGGHNVLQRLLDMGLTPGTKVTLIKAAPFGGPIEIFVRGSKLAIGHGIATKVFVDPAAT